MTRTAPPSILRAWPAIAAGVGTLLGMASCALPIPPMDTMLLRAPIVAVLVTLGVFRLLLPVFPAAATAEERDRQLRTAGIVVWAITVLAATGLGIALSGIFVSAGAPTDNGIWFIGTIAGLVLGGILSTYIRRFGAWYYRRHSTASAD